MNRKSDPKKNAMIMPSMTSFKRVMTTKIVSVSSLRSASSSRSVRRATIILRKRIRGETLVAVLGLVSPLLLLLEDIDFLDWLSRSTSTLSVSKELIGLEGRKRRFNALLPFCRIMLDVNDDDGSGER